MDPALTISVPDYGSCKQHISWAYSATHSCIFKSTALCEEVLHYNENTTNLKYKQVLCRFQKKFFERQKKIYVPSFSRCLAPGQANLWAESPPISIVSRLNRMRNFNGRHFFHTRLFLYCSNAWFPKYCGKRALHSLEKSWEVTQHRVPSCGRHLGKLDDVTIYTVLVVARTGHILQLKGSFWGKK